MRQFSYIKNLVLQTILAINIVGLILPAPIFAAQVEITSEDDNSDIHFKDNQFPLPKGTILQIPDEFVYSSSLDSHGKHPFLYTNHDGSANSVKIIDNWLEHAGVKNIENEHGQLDPQFFLKATVIKSPGAHNLKDHIGFVPLNVLAHKGELKFITVKDSAIHDLAVAPSKKDSTQSKKDASHTEATVCLGDCKNMPGVLNQIADALKKSGYLGNVQQSEKGMLRSYDQGMKAIESRFKNTCFGLQLNNSRGEDFDFKNFLIEKSKEKGIPPEIMLGIMTQESAGSCRAVGDKKSESDKSVSLFQINTGTAKDYHVPLCGRPQLAKLQGTNLKSMEQDSSLHCLENPVVNFETSLQIYSDYFKEVNDGQKPAADKPWNQITNQDMYRKALLAYNGGPVYNNQLKRDMKTISKTNNAQLDDSNWDQYRLLVMRRVLVNNGYLAYSKEYDRKIDTVAGNVAYAEAIAGRGNNSQQKGFADEWQDILEPMNSTVASTKN